MVDGTCGPLAQQCIGSFISGISMKKIGTVKRWDAARGFGFIRSSDSSADVFFHVRDFRTASGVLPAEGMSVQFEEIHVGGKGPRAMAVQPTGLTNATHPSSPQRQHRTANERSGKPPADVRTRASAHERAEPRTQRRSNAQTHDQRWVVPVMLLWVIGVLGTVWLGRLPWWVAAAFVGINVFTFFAYAFDKNAAQTGQWRTPEKTLHLYALLGGWPAAYLAQQTLRHKSGKTSFQAVYAATVLLHCAALAGWVFWLAPRLGHF